MAVQQFSNFHCKFKSRVVFVVLNCYYRLPAYTQFFCHILLPESRFFSKLFYHIFNKLPRSKLRGISLGLASLGIFVKRSKLRGIRPVSD